MGSWKNCTVLFVLSVATNAWALSPKDVYKKAGPAVVMVVGSNGGGDASSGTGSIVTSEGKIITNAHVVISGNSNRPFSRMYVFTKPPKLTGDTRQDLRNRYEVKLLAYSPADELDLAVLQIKSPPPNLPVIKFANPDLVEIGDEVVAIGHPEQGGLWTLTTGTVSTVIANFNRIRGKHVFQTEASVNRGNSGGPLLDANGNMIGINTMIARKAADGLTITDINFALKSSVAVSWLAGQGMGLAYAPREQQPMMVAVAPQAEKPAAQKAPPPAKKEVSEQPEATIVIAEEPPSKPQLVRRAAVGLGKKKGREKVVSGKPLDPKKAKPKYHTEKRPFTKEDIRKAIERDLENLMDDARGKIRSKSSSKGNGLGLW